MKHFYWICFFVPILRIQPWNLSSPAPNTPHSFTKTLLKGLSHFKQRREEMSSTPTCPFNASMPRVPGAAPVSEGTTEPPNPDGAVAAHDSCQDAGTLSKGRQEEMKASVEAVWPAGGSRRRKADNRERLHFGNLQIYLPPAPVLELSRQNSRAAAQTC